VRTLARVQAVPSEWNLRATVTAHRSKFLFAKNYRSKSACTVSQRKRINNQAVWPVILRITGPICARAPKSKIQPTLGLRGHQDWPVMRITRERLGRASPNRCRYTQMENSAVIDGIPWLIAGGSAIGPRSRSCPRGSRCRLAAALPKPRSYLEI